MSTHVGGISTKNDRKDGKSGTPPSQQAGAPNAGAQKKPCLHPTWQYCHCDGEGCAKYTSDEDEFGEETQEVNKHIKTLRQYHEKAMQDQLNALEEKEKEAKEHEAATKRRKEITEEIALHTKKMQMEMAAKLLEARQLEIKRQAQKLQTATAGFHKISQELENTFNNLNKLCCTLGNNVTEETIADATQQMRTLEALYAKIDIPALNKQLQLVTIPATKTTTPSGSGSIGIGGKRKFGHDKNAGGGSSKKQKRREEENSASDEDENSTSDEDEKRQEEENFLSKWIDKFFSELGDSEYSKGAIKRYVQAQCKDEETFVTMRARNETFYKEYVEKKIKANDSSGSSEEESEEETAKGPSHKQRKPPNISKTLKTQLESVCDQQGNHLWGLKRCTMKQIKSACKRIVVHAQNEADSEAARGWLQSNKVTGYANLKWINALISKTTKKNVATQEQPSTNQISMPDREKMKAIILDKFTLQQAAEPIKYWEIQEEWKQQLSSHSWTVVEQFIQDHKLFHVVGKKMQSQNQNDMLVTRFWAMVKGLESRRSEKEPMHA